MSNIRIRSIRIAATAAAGLLLAATAPANATENSSSASNAAAARSAVAKTSQTRSAVDPFQEVCVRGYQTSGTLVRRHICQSRQAWERVGGVPN